MNGKVKITVTVFRKRIVEESGEIEIEVPQSVIDDGELFEWVEENISHDTLDPVMSESDEDVELTDVEEA